MMLRKGSKFTLLKAIKAKIQQNNEDHYLIINLIFAGIILVVLIYSGIFSASGIPHPIKSQSLGPVVSTGLSRAFSEIVRLNFNKALEFNPYSIHIFLFFFIQLLLRIFISFLLLSTSISKKLLLFTDILTSVLLFLLSFFHFISAQL
jgi:hypothetical protein